MQAFVALFQFLSSLLLFPLNIIPNFGQLTLSEIPQNMLDALRCFVNLPTSHPDDMCELAWLPVLGYAFCNFIFNITSLYVIKELSSAVVYIQNAIRYDLIFLRLQDAAADSYLHNITLSVRLPLVTVAFHLTFIMGAAALPWDYTSWYLFGGLAVILVGLILYMFTALKDLRAKLAPSVSEKSPLLNSDSWRATSSDPNQPDD